MGRWAWTAAALVALAAPAAAAGLPPCEAGPGREAAALAGTVTAGQRLDLAFGPGYTLSLAPAVHGWDLAVLDGNGMDLSQLTPPLHGPNPRQLYGWHFRNADNTGPNEGSVNAPQAMRLLVFSPALSGTGGVRPSGEIAPEDVAGSDGRGAFLITDFGLADLEQGQQARMVHLAFEACLSWTATAATDDTGPANAVTPELVEQMGACGLTADFRIEPYLNTPFLGGDFDGDGSHDLATPVTRAADGKRGIAICRAGTWLDIVGLEGEMGELVPAYFDRIDWWSLHAAATPLFAGPESAPVPALRGDGIVIGKEDSSSVLFYWTPDGYASWWQGD